MELNDFIAHFAMQFEGTDASLFTPDLEFRDLDEWGSMMGLVIIAMVDEEYGVALKGDDIKGSRTIRDLFEIVKSNITR